MAWTTPRTWTDEELIDAAIMNPHVRDNLVYLKDDLDSNVVLKTLFDVANTILKADVADTPEGLTIAEQRLVGRITDGVITGLTGAQVMALLSGQAGATFSLNSEDLSYVGHIGLGNNAADTRYGIKYAETFAIADNEARMGCYSWPRAYKTIAPFTACVSGVNGFAILDAANTQSWTSIPVSMTGVEGAVKTLAATADCSGESVTGLACFYGGAAFGATSNSIVVTNYYGLYIDAEALVGNSKLTNDYGIYIGDQEGGATLNYAIHTGAGLVHFGDDVDIAASKVLKTDTINEITGNAGVTVDTVLIKDGEVDGVDISAHETAYNAHIADKDAHQPLMIQGLTLTGTDLYIDDTAMGMRQVQLPDAYHLEFEDTTGEVFYVAN